MKLLLMRQPRKTPHALLKPLCLGLAVFLSAALTVLIPQNNLYAQAQTQKKLVKGRVTNEKGEAISGASVLVKGTTTGVNTDAKGDYSIAVATNAVLVISYVGYDAKEIRVTSTTSSVDARLELNNKELDQVIVVGYGTQRKRDGPA